MSRSVPWLLAAFLAAAPLAAQEQPAEPGSVTAREALDRANRAYGPPAPEAEPERCTREQEAAAISGEIVVCRRLNDGNAVSGFDKEAWEERYAAKTAGPQPIVVNDPLIPPMVGVSAVSKGCYLQRCPPPVAYIIDFSALPEPPQGSDADLIARGLKPAR